MPKTSSDTPAVAGSGTRLHTLRRDINDSTSRNSNGRLPKLLARNHVRRSPSSLKANKGFKLVMDNDSVVVARIPDPNVGRVDRVIASEVATMEFVRFYGLFRDETTLTRTRQRKSSAFLFRRSCLGAETNRMLSSPLTFSWSMQEVRSLATYGKILKLARRWLSSTKQSRLRGSSLRSHSHGKRTIMYYKLTCILTLSPKSW